MSIYQLTAIPTGEKRMCTSNCQSGYYSRRKYCCHYCPRQDKCPPKYKCTEVWSECGCERVTKAKTEILPEPF